MSERKLIMNALESLNPPGVSFEEMDIWRFISNGQLNDVDTVNVLDLYLKSKGARQTCSFFSGNGKLCDRLWSAIEKYKSN